MAEWLATRAPVLETWGGPLSAKFTVVLAWVLVAVIAIVDFFMGSEITLRFLYCVPIVLLVSARRISMAVFMAVACDLCWVIGDKIAGAHYSRPSVPLINGAITLGVYLLVIWLLAGLLNLHREMERRVEQRSAALTAEIAERGRLEREIIAISEKERWSLGHDLHDGLAQHFTATALAAQSLACDLDDESHASAVDAYRVVRMIEDGIGQTRRLAKGLLLVAVEGDELVDALREMAATCSAQLRVSCDVHIAGTLGTPDAAVATQLFRIAQEAVRNAARHARPTRIDLWVSGDETGIFLAVRDNGVGLPPVENRGGGMGLRIMPHRAKLIGAAFDIRPSLGGGTVVECRWTRPIPTVAKA
jgi:signal transduction histidine kinase